MNINIIRIALAGVIFMCCQSKPQVIQPIKASSSTTGLEVEVDDPKTKIHEVIVEDFMHTSKYTYLQVKENGNQFWIAIPGTEVEKGKTYYYQGGLLMKNFESVEFNRVFETIYLVSGITEYPIATGQSLTDNTIKSTSEHLTGQLSLDEIGLAPGGVSIRELFSNKEKYSGKVVKVRGQCIKINRNIMSRNWIHLRDKSISDNDLDLTITTLDNISVGDIVTFEGIISLNKDFGAGYKYDIIMEDAQTIL